MMIILLYSAAILIETILLLNCLRLRSVEASFNEQCSSLEKHLNIFHGNIKTNHSNVSDTLYLKIS